MCQASEGSTGLPEASKPLTFRAKGFAPSLSFAAVFSLWQRWHIDISRSRGGNGAPPAAIGNMWSTVLAGLYSPRAAQGWQSGWFASFALRSFCHALVL
jgi:hypothetical protein